MSYKPNYYDRERVAGAQLARKLGALKTAGAIEDQTKNFEDIFAVARAELGLDRLAEELAHGSAVWAHAALAAIPDLGAHRDRLLKRAAEAPDGAISPGSTTARTPPTPLAAHALAAVGTVTAELSKMTLNNHMAADCQWTMEWIDAEKQQPTANYPDWNSWKWSGTLTAGCGSTMSGSDCAQKVPNSPLKDGDEIWIYVWVAGGSDKNGRDDLKSFRFTYKSGTSAGAVFGISGTTLINTLSVEQLPS